MNRILLLLACLSPLVRGLDNGLALTPPMGWLSWERFTCNTDCKNDPENCISERLYKEMADRLVADGYRDAGYEYVNIDDCWLEKERDSDGNLVPDRERFPGGIKALSDYMHARGLKLGIYQDVGVKTCAEYPGSYGYFEKDAKLFAEWEVDSLKVDGCFADPKEMDQTYPAFSKEVNKTSRPILFSCEWPFYQQVSGIKPNYTQIAKYCNIWRYFNDIDDSWSSVLTVVDYFAANQDDLVAASGPGSWNDPDMVLAGNFGLSYDEAKAQFMLWAIMASPLLMSNDLRNIGREYGELLRNKEIIQINQDPLGKTGRRVHKENNIEIWTRPISPMVDGNYSYAVLFFNRNSLGNAVTISAQLKSIGLDDPRCYSVYDVLTPRTVSALCPDTHLAARVNPSSTTMFVVKLTQRNIRNIFKFKH